MNVTQHGWKGRKKCCSEELQISQEDQGEEAAEEPRMGTQKHQQKQTPKHVKKAKFQDGRCLYTSVVSEEHLHSCLKQKGGQWYQTDF